MTRPCPACDIQHSDDPLFCLALGVALGSGFGDMHAVTEMMCKAHRTAYVMAMLKADVLSNTVPSPRVHEEGGNG